MFHDLDLGFEPDHIRLYVFGGGIDLVVVPERVDGIRSGCGQKNGDNEGNDRIGGTEKNCGKSHISEFVRKKSGDPEERF